MLVRWLLYLEAAAAVTVTLVGALLVLLARRAYRSYRD